MDQSQVIKLANLKHLDPAKGTDHSDEMWHIIRALAVLDWTMRQPDPPPFNQEKYETITRKIQQLAEVVCEEQGLASEETVVN